MDLLICTGVRHLLPPVLWYFPQQHSVQQRTLESDVVALQKQVLETPATGGVEEVGCVKLSWIFEHCYFLIFIIPYFPYFAEEPLCTSMALQMCVTRVAWDDRNP